MAPPQSPQSSHEGSSGLLWIVAAVFAAIGIIWYTYKDYIILAFLQVKLWEMDFLKALLDILGIDRFDTSIEGIRLLIVSFLQTTDKSLVTFDNVVALGEQAGDLFKIPFLILLFILAIIVYTGNSTRIFKRAYSMKELAKLEKVNWPQITPVVGLDLLKQDIDKGAWAMAMTPMQFCKNNQLLEEYKRVSQEAVSLKERNKIEVNLKRGLANKIFALQLGPVWPGIPRLPLYIKALFAIFAARIAEDSKGAAALVTKINLSSGGKTLSFAGTEELLKKHESNKIVQRIISSHAYLLSVMASMLQAARDDGVQASADFLWLKPRDRKLWYMLNTVGRQTPFVEVAGPFAHWIAEKELGRSILVPMVEEATNALEIALKEIIYKPEEEK